MDYTVKDFEDEEYAVYTSECEDHDEIADLLIVGNSYPILHVASDRTILINLGEDGFGETISWWVHIRHLKPESVGNVDKNNPYYKVIRKVQLMNARRLKNGYAF
jgi:hypothetical protein